MKPFNGAAWEPRTWPPSLPLTGVPEELLRDIIEWDVMNWGQCLAYWAPVLRARPESGGRALVLGDPRGGLSLWLALQGYEVICTDYRAPLPLARAQHQHHSVAHRVGYLQVDAFHIPFLDDSFDLVACKSVIGGLKTVYRDASTRSLAGQKLATNEIRRVLKPGACFLGAENLRATKVHQMLTWLHRRGRVGWRHLTQGEIRFLFGDYQRLHLRPYGFLGTRSRWSGYNRLTGGIDRVLSEWLPGRWLYIAFIVAQK